MAAQPLILSFPEAFAMVNEYAREYMQGLAAGAQESEEVSLSDSLHRVLAAPVIADRDQPPFPRATRDGFAGRAAEWAEGALQVIGTVRAGEAWTHGLVAKGACIEIMTGAPVPPGADCVVMVEHVRRDGHAVALLSTRAIAAGENIVPRGAEAAAGSELLPVGTRMRAAGIAAAAGSGAATVKVWKRPRVAILATGDELVGLHAQPGQWQIRNSNSYSMAAQVLELGGEPLLYPPVPDDADALRAAIEEASRQSDLLLLSGGVSMGRFDLVEPALEQCGGSFRFTGVRMQPGKPLVFGTMRHGALPVFGLPGNPVSTMVCFSLFVAPVLAALAGETGYVLPCALARSASVLTGKPSLTRFLPAKLHRAIDGASVQPIPWQGSGDAAAAARGDCFVVIPEDTAVRAGDIVTVLLS